MKRILKAISILLLAFLVGCSGTKEETKVYTKQQKGIGSNYGVNVLL